MAQREKGGRVVFIGNIPYGVSEEQICEIFGRVGNVVSFRLVYDKETNKPKGFGFLEYTDVDAAASAVRNLNEFEVMGRTLRVDYSNDNGGGRSKDQTQQQQDTRAPPPAHFNAQAPAQSNGAAPAPLPPLPPGVDLPAGMSAPDAISKTLATIPPAQLLDILSQMKTLATENPMSAAALLAQAPQLSYAIFQALLLLGLVDTNKLQELLPGAQAAPPPQTPIQAPPSIAHQYQQQAMPPQYAQPPPQQYSTPMPLPYQQGPPHGYAPTPPVQQPAYNPPPVPQAQPPPPSAPPGMPPDQAALIQQILAMSREQIFALDPVARDQIVQLRAQFGAPVM
ncbi:hypothetical protein BAUCODRAFT_34465 [Baudoinia panamericana UAMH 10762]|uniref:RRM domain-containing protein n=1 Tax=Baudoinia panamericana (strain UAMH 10762) TaxID=717646 RepID=M2LMY7_BAUPA|nr:uncharacterized protein BAUCODRAFT_34465 [Baudoinia panamericana UAMH 10762]EMC95702.1 hypothetical protein BAUCODRAFT_34465 [Baudoinia panamericana UAMH 10762]